MNNVIEISRNKREKKR